MATHNIIGLVVPDGINFLNSHYFTEMLHGIGSEAGMCGYDLLLRVINSGDEEKQVQPWESKNCDGLLIAAPLLDDANIRVLEKKNFPVVLINSTSEHLSYVDINGVDGAMQAVQHLTQLGHRKIAIINGFMKGNNAIDRFYGYKTALYQSKIKLNPDMVVYGNFKQDGGYHAMKKLLSLKTPPTAVFAANDAMAFGALKAIRESGRTVPYDISIVGFDDIELAGLADPPLTTLRQPMQELGRAAVRLLTEQIKKNKLLVRKIVLKPQLICRQSTTEIKDEA